MYHQTLFIYVKLDTKNLLVVFVFKIKLDWLENILKGSHVSMIWL